MSLDPRTRSALVRLARLVVFGVVGALATMLVQASGSGRVALDPNVLLAACVTAGGDAILEWLSWVEKSDPTVVGDLLADASPGPQPPPHQAP